MLHFIYSNLKRSFVYLHCNGNALQLYLFLHLHLYLYLYLYMFLPCATVHLNWWHLASVNCRWFVIMSFPLISTPQRTLIAASHNQIQIDICK